MHVVSANYPESWKTANVYTLADLHAGDAHASEAEIARRIREIEQDENGLCVLNGDLVNMALKNSPSDIYGEKRSPMQQITRLCELLSPISGKTIAVTTGNHEARIYRNDGVDIMRLVCRELGLEDRYCPEGVLIFLRFGTKAGHGRHRDNQAQWYTLYATHGSGGGRKEGAKAIRLADMAATVDADVYIHSHTHLPMVMKEAFFRVSPANASVSLVDKLFVNTGAALTYGGYGQTYEFKPSSMRTPVIHLDALRKNATATL